MPVRPVSSHRIVPVLGAWGLVLLAGCGGKTGDLVRPEDYRGDAVMGAAVTCSATPSPARPLTVDLDSATREDLEAQLDQGLVVVAYDCKSLRVLPDCGLRSAAGYEYAGLSVQEDVVQMTGLDELAVNVPLGSVNLGAEMKSGHSIDVALVSVGRRSSTVTRLGADELTGTCEGATHYVRRASIGAFSMAKGSVGKVAAVVDLFKASASGQSASERSAMSRGGSLEACRTAGPGAAAPPQQCALPIRLDLTPIASSDATATDDATRRQPIEAAANPCPEGFAFTDGVCTRDDGPHLCDPGDPTECREQCTRGNAESCTNLGAYLVAHGENTPAGWERSFGEAMPFFKRACDAGAVEGCAGLARVMFPIEITRATLAQAKRSIELGKRACEAGSAAACQDVSLAYFNGSGDETTMPRDYDAYREFAERACDLGNHYSCGDAGEEYVAPNGSNAKDPAKALAFFARGCNGGEAQVCTKLADRLLRGTGGVTKDVAAGLVAASDACLSDPEECFIVAGWVKGAGRPKDAFELLSRGCTVTTENRYLEESCAELGDYYAAGIGTTKDAARAKAAWTTACDARKAATPDSWKASAACKKLEGRAGSRRGGA